MFIHCTKKLLDQLKIKPVEAEEENPLFSWHANLITLERRKTVILTNNQNWYVIVLHGLKAKDFKNLDQLIIQGIRETFQLEGVDEAVIDQYVEEAKGIVYTNTQNRTQVARLNKACEEASFYMQFMEKETDFDGELGKSVSNRLIGTGKKDYIYPSEEMYKVLEGLAGRTIFKTTAVELKVTLRLEHHSVWRKLIVPVNLTFNAFHKVLQRAFGWKDYHLHEFYIYGQEKMEGDHWKCHSAYSQSGLKPIVNLVSDEEALSYGDDEIPMRLEAGIRLSEYMPAHMKYVYDLGDDWQHEIEVLRMRDDYDQNQPVCLDGSGQTPPEDVGGEGGYDEFLEIIKDPTHSDYQHMMTWAVSQGYLPFDIERVNRELRLSW